MQDVLSKYKQMEGFHRWIKGKHNKGEPMPESREELMQMYRYEKPSFLMDGMRRSPSRQEQKYMIRRHHT